MVVIHYNPALAHQRDHAARLTAAVTRFGANCMLTIDPRAEGDMHIVSGPHYALPYWRHHPRVLMIDRSPYGDPEYLSVGWLQPGGGRRHPRNSPGDRWAAHCRALGLAPLPLQAGGASCLLGDYDGDRRFYARLIRQHSIKWFRPHPQDAPWPDCPARRLDGGDLGGAFQREGIGRCYGGVSTALSAAAALYGCEIVCHDPASIAAGWLRERHEAWCYDLAYSIWTLAELESGACWEYHLATAPAH